MATRSFCDAVITRVAVLPSLASACSVLTSAARCLSRVAIDFGSESIAVARVAFCAFSFFASASTAVIAVTICCLFLSRVPTKVFSWVSTLRMAGSFPVSALFSSWVMICNWATPPPFSSSERADSTSSTSTLLVVRDNGMSSPFSSLPRGFSSPVGGASETNFSPSRLVCRIVARELSGRSTLFGSFSFTLAT